MTRGFVSFLEENWRERMISVNTEVIGGSTTFCRASGYSWRLYIVVYVIITIYCDI